MSLIRLFSAIGIALVLSACASQVDAGISAEPNTPGFLWGLWHGFILPWSFVGSFFSQDIAIYAVPNKGTFYDIGFFLGVTVLGGGSVFGSKKRS